VSSEISKIFYLFQLILSTGIFKTIKNQIYFTYDEQIRKNNKNLKTKRDLYIIFVVVVLS